MTIRDSLLAVACGMAVMLFWAVAIFNNDLLARRQYQLLRVPRTRALRVKKEGICCTAGTIVVMAVGI